MLSRVILLCTTIGWAASLVINPKITSPRSGDVWKAKSIQTVKWNTKDIPDPNAKGSIILGYKSKDRKDTSEHLDYEHPLATGFKLTDGKHEVVIPDVAARSTYIIVLLGDTGNASPEFRITPA